MSSLKLALQVDSFNSTVNDLYIDPSTGSFRLTSSLLEEVAQQVWVRLRSFKGEWFLDPTIGFPWFQAVLGQKTPLPILAQMFRFVVSTTPGVASLDRFDVKRLPNRGLVVSFRATLQDGAVLTEAQFAPFVVPKVGA